MRSPIFLVLTQLLFTENGLAIKCSICGQSNLTAPGECTSQFEYDCVSDPRNVEQHGQTGPEIGQPSRILCRTTRTKLNENLFAVVKECVSEQEHSNRYQHSKSNGCETIRSNSTYPSTTYCVCDQDLCNANSIDDQLKLAQSPPTANLRPQIRANQPSHSQPALSLETGQQRQSTSDQNQHQPNVNSPSQNQGATGTPVALSPSQESAEYPLQSDTLDSQSAPVPSEGINPTPNIPSSNRSGHQPSGARGPSSSTTPRRFVILNTERVQFLPEESSSTPAPRSNSSGLIVLNQNNCGGNICNGHQRASHPQPHQVELESASVDNKEETDIDYESESISQLYETSPRPSNQPAVRHHPEVHRIPPNGLLIPPSSRLPLVHSHTPASPTPAGTKNRSIQASSPAVTTPPWISQLVSYNEGSNKSPSPVQMHVDSSENATAGDHDTKQRPMLVRKGAANLIDHEGWSVSAALAPLPGILNWLALIVEFSSVVSACLTYCISFTD